MGNDNVTFSVFIIIHSEEICSYLSRSWCRKKRAREGNFSESERARDESVKESRETVFVRFLKR
jgi:hypothetical protein